MTPLAVKPPKTETGSSQKPVLPARTVRAIEDANAGQLRQLRRFHWTGSGDGQGLPAEYLPALLHAYRDPERARPDYPLLVAPPRDGSFMPLTVGVGELLAEATAEAGRVLLDNIPRLELEVRRLADTGETPPEARDLMKRAGRAMVEKLSLPDAERERLEADLKAATDSFPEDGRFVPLDAKTSLRLFAAVAEARLGGARDAFSQEVSELVRGLRDLLETEEAKRPESREAGAVAGGLGAFGARFLNPEALSGVVGAHRGTETMGPEREQRIRSTLRDLEEWTGISEAASLVLAHGGASSAVAGLEREGWRVVLGRDACATATTVFDQHAEELARILRAVRTARLEIGGGYDAERHGPWLEQIDWQAFSRHELSLLPRIVALVDAEMLARGEVPSWSALLLSGRPVQVFVEVDPAAQPGADNESTQLEGFRFEPGYLGLSLREVLVQQTTAVRPGHMLRGFARATAAARTGFHVVARVGEAPRLGPWFETAAAVEGRAHPLFFYDPEAGRSWARRLDFSENPAPAEDWPVEELEATSGDGKAETLRLAFTFADFAVLEASYGSHFQLLDDEMVTEDLVPVADYLDLDDEAAAEKIPFVWVVGADARAHRAAVTRRLALACRDRRGFWHTLQELAGVHSEYVEEAVARARKEAEAEHRRELESLREEIADEVVERIVRALVSEEALLAPAAPAAEAPAAAPVAEAGPAADVDEEPAAEPEAEEEPEEAYVDTELCTTCNDCININPRIFVYNADKKAFIQDAAAGPFRHLVEAAEKCPTRIIHPGSPMDPDEPDLEALVARAAKLN